MAAFAELALAELATVEIARDARMYADILAAATALFSADASLGRVVSVVGSSTLGVAPQDHLSSLVTQPAQADVTFTADAAGSMLANIAAMQTWRWSGGAAGSRVIDSSGSAQWSFAGDSHLVNNDEIWAIGTWAWASSAVAEAHANAVGQGALTFSHVTDGTAVFNTSAATDWVWGSAGRVTVAITRAAGDQIRFATSAPSAPLAHIDAGGQWAFSPVARVGEVAVRVGQGVLSFTSLGGLDTRTALPFLGAASLTLVGDADLAGRTEGQATALTSFSALARVGILVNAQAQAQLLFDQIARPGSAFFSSLPPAHTGFEVPANADAWIVPEEIELGAV